jgi:NTP pyrophosphatase (non-canonical NTP hydrolase)
MTVCARCKNPVEGFVINGVCYLCVCEALYNNAYNKSKIEDTEGTFDYYQKESHKRSFYNRDDVPPLMYAALGLAGEAGEVANKVKKVYRDDGNIITPERRRQIIKELGGALWYLAEVATVIGVTLSEVAAENMSLLEERSRRGTLGGDGDDR